MPSCPGCGEVVAYTELSSHVATCKWVWSNDPAGESNRSDALAVRIRQLEWRLFQSSEEVTPVSPGVRGRPKARDSRPNPEDDPTDE